ncbi:MAG: YkgJ family cysteine cluster protein [Anaerohalosphaeraceae bacterium]|nr:YkgJ family cysteine cluster protein [Anaerohalosphaeraceae bacterium]
MAAKKNLCDKCTGLCCRYMALPIETPEDRDDFDDIRWYLCHKNIAVFVEDGDWYINVKNVCKHLDSKTYRCKIYDTRPNICRKYHKDCELTGEEYDYDLHFTNDKQMQEYINIKFDNNKNDHPASKAAGKKAKASKKKK